MRRALLVACCFAFPVVISAQGVSLEYEVKAAYLYNFLKFVEWPPTAPGGQLTICVAERNPFGEVLVATLRGEFIAGRPVTARVIAAPDVRCHVLFIPRNIVAAPYLRSLQSAPVLTVGESTGFTEQGGMINFVLEERHVRFEINREAAERAGLRISSRLLRLSRAIGQGGTT